jgi:hypothetical protein
MAENDGFDVKAALTGSAKAIVATLGERSLAELRTMHSVEADKGPEARISLLKPLKAEIDARELAQPGLTLSDESMRRLGALAYFTGSPDRRPGDELDQVLAAELAKQARQMLAVSRPINESKGRFECAVRLLAPLLVELEAAKAAQRPADDGTVPAKIAAEPEKKPENVLAQVAELAFCDGDTVRFRRRVTAEDFTLQGRKARFARETELRRDKPAVRIDTVVALDKGGRALGKCRWPKALEGGGGRLATFLPGYVSFDL